MRGPLAPPDIRLTRTPTDSARTDTLSLRGVTAISPGLWRRPNVTLEQEPTNAASLIVAAIHLNGVAYDWKKAGWEDVNTAGEFTSHVCISAYAPKPDPGDINVSTC